MPAGDGESVTPPGRAWRAEAACLLALLGFSLAMVAPVLSGGVPVAADTLALWAPQAVVAPRPVNNQLLADSALLYLPWQVFIRRSLAGGEWPLWNPDLFAGYPFQGNPQTQLYYPVAWLLWLLPLSTALQANVLLHLWLAGAGMYALSRVLGASRTGSLLAALAFAASGQLYLGIEITGVSNIYVWLPWVLAASEVAWRRRSWAWAAGAGLLYGLLALSGHLQWFIYSSMFLALWLGARVAALGLATYRRGPREGPPRREFWGQAARAAAILALGPALAMVQLLPFLELTSLSTRAAAPGLPVGADEFGRALRLLGRQLHLFVPRFFGYPVGGGVGLPLGAGNCWYVGLAPLALAFIAPLLRRERRVLFLWAVGVAMFGVAAQLPFFNLLHRLPGLQTQLPDRMAYLFIFCAAALSGPSFDALLAAARRRPTVAAGAGALLVLLGLGVGWLLSERHASAAGDPALFRLQATAMGQASLVAGGLCGWLVALLLLRGDRLWRGRAMLAGSLLAVTAVDLLTYAPGFNTYVPAESLRPRAAAADLMLADPVLWRMMAVDTPGPSFVPNSSALYGRGLPDVQGFESLHLARYEEFWAAADPRIREGGYFNVMVRPQSYLSPQADLLGVKYVAMWDPLPGALPPKLAPFYDRDIAVYANRSALPRAFVVPSAEALAPRELQARMARPGFDPLQAVLLEEAPPPGFGESGLGTPGSATITSYKNLSVDIRVELERPGWLVLADVNYPGWHAAVDGQAARLYTAYHTLRAVPLPAGTHHVRFYFLPASALLGAVISAVAALAAGAVICRALLRR